MVFSDVIIFVFLIMKSGFFVHVICKTINPEYGNVKDDYFKTNPGVKDLSWTGIEPQSPSPQPVVIAMSYNDPLLW